MQRHHDDEKPQERQLIAPVEQVFGSYQSPALSLFERFIREAERVYNRGGFPALTMFLAHWHKSAVSDSLTGHFTRDAFFQVVDKIVLTRMRRHPPAIGETYGSLAVLDLDRFKKVNAAFGHAGGDAVLKVFGELLRKVFRADDVIGRVGGDEFLVIAAGLSTDDVERRMQELKASFASHPWQLERIDDRDDPIQMSFSYSVISITDPDKIKDLIISADRDVFRLKRRRDDVK